MQIAVNEIAYFRFGMKAEAIVISTKLRLVMSTLDSTFAFHQASLRILGTRQSVIASNIANEATPGYKARDLPFAETLNQVLAARKPEAVSVLANVQQRAAKQPSADGNTVDENIEREQFAQNAVRYEASLTLLSSEVKEMLTVLQA